MSQRTLMIALCLLCACGGEQVDLSNRGYACVQSGTVDADGYYEPAVGAALEVGASSVVVVLDSCHSGSYQDEHASCTFEANGQEILVSSEGGYVIPNGPWTSDCQTLVGVCDGPDLTEGSWSLTYAGKTVDFEVPDATSPCTGGDRPPSSTPTTTATGSTAR